MSSECRITVLPFILLCAISVLAQDNQCSLKFADLPPAPELVGFHLGMTTEQVKARVPQVVFGGIDEFGVSKTTINPDFDPRIDKSTFAGVRSVSLDFLDGRLTSLWFGYDGSFKAHTLDEFVRTISQSLHLPNDWTSWRVRGQQMRCADFQITVTMVAEAPSFRLIDQTAEETVVARREAKEAQEAAATEATEDAPEIVGERHDKIYYPVGCQPQKEIAETDRIVFKSIEEAQKAGYKVAKSCPD